jgi:hypothetical protein
MRGNKQKLLLVCALAFFVGAQVMADDLSPAPFRYDPGTMFMEWTYDSDAPNNGIDDRWDGAEQNNFVPHTMKEDPADWQGGWEDWGYEVVNGVPYDPCNPDLSYVGVHGNQLWAEGSGMEEIPGDPCSWIDTAPIWIRTLAGRTGVMADFVAGSWDMFNFVHDQPVKEIHVQITYFNLNNPGTAVEMNHAGVGADNVYDPCAPALWFDAQLESPQVLEGGWIYELFIVTIWPNPEYEWLERRHRNRPDCHRYALLSGGAIVGFR